MNHSSHQREPIIPSADLRRHEPHRSGDGSAKTPARARPVRLRTSGVTMQTLADGTILVRPDEGLRPYPTALTDRVIHWANVAPDRCCIAKRGADGEWQRLTYSQVMESAKSIGQALLDRFLAHAGRATCRHSDSASFTGVFARLEGFREVAARAESADARIGIRFGWQTIFSRH